MPNHDIDAESARIIDALRRLPDDTVSPTVLAAAAGLPLRAVLRRLESLETARLVSREDDGVRLVPTYDGDAINAEWGNQWPTGTDVNDLRHEFSPVLQAPLANLLGEPWYLENSSPGGDYVTWLDLADGRHVGVSPHPAQDNTMRWMITILDRNGEPQVQDHTMPIDTPIGEVAQHVHRVVTSWGVALPGADYAQVVAAAWNANLHI